MGGEIVFEESVVKSHRLANKYLSDLDSLCRNEKDYGHKDYFHCIICCLDMDAVERDGQGISDCTMDAAVGIATNNGNRIQNPRFALVELRLGYTSVNNFDFSNMERKISHTRELLLDSVIHPIYYFVYPEHLYSKAVYRFSCENRTKGKKKYWEAVSPSSFMDKIKFMVISPLVFKPATDIDKLKIDFKQSFSDNPLSAVALFTRWCDSVYKYFAQNNRNEANAILDALKEVVDGINYGKDADIQTALELIQGDVIWNIYRNN